VGNRVKEPIDLDVIIERDAGATRHSAN
jgi:hypothetical protein